MSKPKTQPTLAELLSTMATLTSAQHTLLERISESQAPVTVAELAEAMDLHVSSVRETTEALYDMGLVSREQRPAHGRGRPALAYSTTTPADPTFPAQMLDHITSSVLDFLRESCPDPVEAARQIGRNWAGHALASMGVPDHSRLAGGAPDGFILADHMGKIRLFLSALGFAAVSNPSHPTSFVLQSCPFTDPVKPDPLALEVRRGLVENVLERTATGMATWTYTTNPKNTMQVTVTLTKTRPPRPNTDAPLTTVYFFGGAAEAAGCDSRELATTPATLGELLDQLATATPGLAPIFAVSSYLVGQQPADRSTALTAGIRVDVLPPFAGG